MHQRIFKRFIERNSIAVTLDGRHYHGFNSDINQFISDSWKGDKWKVLPKTLFKVHPTGNFNKILLTRLNPLGRATAKGSSHRPSGFNIEREILNLIKGNWFAIKDIAQFTSLSEGGVRYWTTKLMSEGKVRSKKESNRLVYKACVTKRSLL